MVTLPPEVRGTRLADSGAEGQDPGAIGTDVVEVKGARTPSLLAERALAANLPAPLVTVTLWPRTRPSLPPIGRLMLLLAAYA